MQTGGCNRLYKGFESLTFRALQHHEIPETSTSTIKGFCWLSCWHLSFLFLQTLFLLQALFSLRYYPSIPDMSTSHPSWVSHPSQSPASAPLCTPFPYSLIKPLLLHVFSLKVPCGVLFTFSLIHQNALCVSLSSNKCVECISLFIKQYFKSCIIHLQAVFFFPAFAGALLHMLVQNRKLYTSGVVWKITCVHVHITNQMEIRSQNDCPI